MEPVDMSTVQWWAMNRLWEDIPIVNTETPIPTVITGLMEWYWPYMDDDSGNHGNFQ